MSEKLAKNRNALSSRNFRIFLYGNTISVLGIWIQRLALGWQAWQLSESSLLVGVVAAGQFLPLLLLTPFFGVLVDRIRPRYGAIMMHCIFMCIAFMLGAATITDRMSIELLVALSFCHGMANSAYSPFRLALIPDLVPPQQFPHAVAISAVVFNVTSFVGPGIAGAIVSLYGLGFAYFANGASYLPVILSLLVIRTHRKMPAAPHKRNYLAELLEGLRYTRDHATIRQVIIIAGVSTFFGRGVFELLPAFAAMIFHGGSVELAALMSAAGAGAILTSLMFSVSSIHRHLHAAVLAGAGGVVVSITLFAVAGSLALGLAAMAVLGASLSAVSIGSQSEVQVKVEDRLRGRVLSLWTLVLVGGPAAGSIVAGWLAAEIRATNTLYLFAALCLTSIIAAILHRRHAAVVHKGA
jgi:MFS family permease